MRRSRLILLGALVVLVGPVFFALNRNEKKPATSEISTTTPAPQATPPIKAQVTPATPGAPSAQAAKAAERSAAVEAVRSLYSAPIAFYGKAQDQHGDPVAGAKVEYSALDKFWEPRNKV